MINKKVYKEYFLYNRNMFNGIMWFYDIDDLEDSDMDVFGAIHDDLQEFGFSSMNINL